MPARSCGWLLDALQHPAMLIDFDGRVVAANPAAGAVVGDPLLACLDGWSDADAIAAVAVDDAAGPGFEREFAVRNADGRRSAIARARRLGAPGAVLTLVTIEPHASEADLAGRHATATERLRRIRTVRHELNNLLMGLLGHAELLADAEELSPASRRRLETIVAQAGRIREQVDTLRRETSFEDDD